MIFDGENMFFRDKALSAATLTSDVIKVGEGESSEPMKVHSQVKGGDTNGTLAMVIQTAEDEDFTTPVTLCTAVSMDFAMPRGNKGYIRMKAVSTHTKGELTSGLVLDDDIH